MKWYLLKTKPNGHITACENLKQQGFEIFLPLILKTSKIRGKFVNKLTPLFSNYLFLGTKNTEIPWKSINSTRGILNAVTLDGTYRSINPEIINSIRIRCDENDVLKSLGDIEPGDQVKIETGPLANFICNVERVSETQRAWVLIDMLQQKTKAEVFVNSLSKIN